MIIITRPGVTDEELDHIRERIEALGPRTHLIRGKHRTVVLCIGDQEDLANVPMLSIPGVEAVRAVMKPYKLASRLGHEESSEVAVAARRSEELHFRSSQDPAPSRTSPCSRRRDVT